MLLCLGLSDKALSVTSLAILRWIFAIVNVTFLTEVFLAESVFLAIVEARERSTDQEKRNSRLGEEAKTRGCYFDGF